MLRILKLRRQLTRERKQYFLVKRTFNALIADVDEAVRRAKDGRISKRDVANLRNRGDRCR